MSMIVAQLPFKHEIRGSEPMYQQFLLINQKDKFRERGWSRPIKNTLSWSYLIVCTGGNQYD